MLGGRYAMRSRIAGGGMGEVWIAHDDVLDRTVAVKVIRRELAEDPEFARRFHQEARTAARLSHANIAQVHDFGRDADTDYLVMEYVRGTSLASMIDQHPGGLPPAQVVSLVGQAADGLEAAHEAGVVHRDVKPANILITDKGQVKITDFGIAKAVDAAPVTQTGMVMGTAQYISPEQATGDEATAASDVYSLGVVGYEALTGRRPFLGDGAITVAMKHIRETPPPLPANVPASVRELIDITLSKDPKQRYANGGEFADAVEAAVERALAVLPRAEIARASWRDYGAIVVVRDFDEAVPLVDRLAPEHLEIETKDAEALSLKVRNAGAIFVGPYSPVPLGDYAAGSNHVLPTGGCACHSSGLSVQSFLKGVHIVDYSREALAEVADVVVTLANAEDLPAHGEAVTARFERRDEAEAGTENAPA